MSKNRPPYGTSVSSEDPPLTEGEVLLVAMAASILGGILNGVANPDDSYEKTAVETAVRTSRAIIQEIRRG